MLVRKCDIISATISAAAQWLSAATLQALIPSSIAKNISPTAKAKKRYRFSGKERDEESGLDYFGARYFAAGHVRWITADPVGRLDHQNLYTFILGNPLSYIDQIGLQTQSADPKLSIEQIRTEKAAEAAAAHVVVEWATHQVDIQKYGKGRRTGSQSGEASKADVERMNRGENVTGKKLFVCNCTEFPIEAAKVYFHELERWGKPGQEELWREIEAATRDSRGPRAGTKESVESGRGTFLLDLLHDRAGFKTYYWSTGSPSNRLFSPAAVKSTGQYPSHVLPVTGADTGKVISDVSVTVDEFIVTNEGTTRARADAERLLNRLSEETFAIAATNGGEHMFVIANGTVFQVDWNSSSRDPRLINKTTLRDFVNRHTTGVIAVPK
jgi:RHS repeat-associated protein